MCLIAIMTQDAGEPGWKRGNFKCMGILDHFSKICSRNVMLTEGSPQVAQPHQSLKLSPFGRDDRKRGVYSKKKNALVALQTVRCYIENNTN